MRNRESEILEQYIDVYVRQFIEGMDDRFIDEHNSSSSAHSIGDPEMNQNWSYTSINIEKEDSTDEV